MTKKLSITLFFTTLFLLHFPFSVHAASFIFLSPNGQDSNPGTIDQPVATLSRARDLARPLLAAKQDVTITFFPGNYFLDSPLVLGPEDGGQPGHRITYQGPYTGRAVISGGIPLSFHEGANGLWEAASHGIISRDLWVNGNPAKRAFTTDTSNFTLTTEGYSNVPTPVITAISASKYPEVVTHVGWTEYRCPIANASANTLTISQPCWNNVRLDHHGNPGLPVAIEHVRAFLDEPGEWYLDPDSQTIYYSPRPGETLSSQAILGNLTQLITTSSTPSNPLVNLTFKNLTFAHTTWFEPSRTGWVTVQAHTALPNLAYPNVSSTSNATLRSIPSALEFNYTHNLIFDHNIVTRTGNSGLALDQGVKNSSVSYNSFTHLGATGILIGDVTAPYQPPAPTRITEGIQVTNNSLGPLGLTYRSSAGIFLGYVRDNLVSHNNLGDMPYTGISNGWGWGAPDPTLAGNNQITYNKLTDVVHTLLDGGAIYSLGYQPNTQITHNLILDQQERRHRNPGDYDPLYLDHGSSGVTISNNVVLTQSPRGGQHAGGNNQITSNYLSADLIRAPFQSCYPSPCAPTNYADNVIITSLTQAPSDVVNTAGVLPDNSPPPAPGDYNSDHRVDLLDFNLVLTHYHNLYNLYDFNAVISNFNPQLP